MTTRKTARPVRIAVLSDQHIDREHAPDSWELAKHAFKTAAALKVDHVVLAGDTFDCASAMIDDQDAVKKQLKKVGLWHRDRLSIVMGNHDVFHSPHWRTGVDFIAELARQTRPAALDHNVEAFVEWAGDVVDGHDWAATDWWAPYSKGIGNVRLLCAATVAEEMRFSGNGHWWDVVDDPLRNLQISTDERIVLAVHHAPYKSKWQTITNWARGSYEFGFPKSEWQSLRAFVADRDVEAVVCGHLHSLDGAAARWPIGKRCRVFLEGKTGRVGDNPSLGVLTVPPRGAMRWTDVPL